MTRPELSIEARLLIERQLARKVAERILAKAVAATAETKREDEGPEPEPVEAAS